MSPTDPAGVELRRATPDDALAVADLLWSVRSANAATIPPMVHSLESVRSWAAAILLPRHEVWIADVEGRVVGFMALGRPDWVEQIYVDAAYAGRGLGTRLIDLAKRELGGPVQLWTFQSNLGARRFYARLGFVEVEQTDGDNEEGAPDVRLCFTPPNDAPKPADAAEE